MNPAVLKKPTVPRKIPAQLHCDRVNQGDAEVYYWDRSIPGIDRSTLSRQLIGHLSVGIMICNSRRQITLVNGAAKRIAQLDPVGTSLRSASGVWGEMFDFAGRRIPIAKWPCARALSGETVSELECRLVQKEGRFRDILFGAFPISDDRSEITGSLSSMSDVTEHRRQERAFREKAVLDDRAIIAADIHDVLVQGLNSAVLQLEVAERELTEEPEQASDRLRRVRDIARETLAEARRSAWNLGRESFESEDPAVALQFLAGKMFNGANVEVQLSLEPEVVKQSSQIRDGLLRIGKEAMANVLKHSRATRVRIELMYREQQVRFVVSDNGKGFISGALSMGKIGFGLLSFQTRAEQLGGRVDVYSRVGHGTRVIACLPILSESA